MNNYEQFIKLFKTDKETVVDIVSTDTNSNTSNATTLSGQSVIVKGTSVSSGNKAFVRNGEIVRQAPNLSKIQIDV